MKILGPVMFALIAAMGNGMFAAGQKKAYGIENPFAFISLTAMICMILTGIGAVLFGHLDYGEIIRRKGGWVLLSGGGLFFTFLGFNLLYSKYGVSNYILYAVISIITTSIIVGVLLFKETFNLYHWLAFFTSMVTVVLFTVGNSIGKA